MAPPRADAARNRQALIDAAAELFVARGVGVALDEIARAAGVSIATLYRNFATREDLVAATYQREIASITDAGAFLHGASGARALQRWIERMVDYSHTKRAIAEVLHALPSEARPPIRDDVVAALDRILAAGRADGTLRDDLNADDVLAALAGLWTLPDERGSRARARRLGEFVLRGLRAD